MDGSAAARHMSLWCSFLKQVFFSGGNRTILSGFSLAIDLGVCSSGL